MNKEDEELSKYLIADLQDSSITPEYKETITSWLNQFKINLGNPPFESEDYLGR